MWSEKIKQLDGERECDEEETKEERGREGDRVGVRETLCVLQLCSSLMRLAQQKKKMPHQGIQVT